MLDGKNFRACYNTLTQKIDMCRNRFYSKTLLKHKMVTCNKDISVHLDGFEVPYIMEHLSRRILLEADTKYLFRESGRTSRHKPIREHFANKGAIQSEDAWDVHQSCSLYKRWMHTLADPLVPIEIQKLIVKRIESIGPEPHSFHLHGMAEILFSGGLSLSLVCVIHCIFFLQQIVHLHHENSMNADALGRIFAMIFFKEEIYSRQEGELFKPIIDGLSLFLEYLLTGLADSVIVEALESSELNKRRGGRNKPGHVSVVRAHGAAPPRPRPRNESLANEPVLLEWRTAAFDSASMEDHRVMF